MKRWRIIYRDQGDDGCPDFSQIVKAPDREAAELAFYDDPGWEIVRIEPVKNR